MKEKTIPAIRSILTICRRVGHGQRTTLTGFDQRGNVVWRKYGTKAGNTLGAMKYHKIPVKTIHSHEYARI